MSEKLDIKSMTLDELTDYVEKAGEKKYRAGQLFEWMHAKRVKSFDEMTNLSKSFREQLKEETSITCLVPVRIQQSRLDGTRKYLFALGDGSMIESVLMRYRHGNSICISSQAGCRMGCRFCASTIAGLVRNLTPSEMLDQIYRISSDLDERIANVVVMGTGEPLDNYDNLLRFVELLGDPKGFGLSRRNLTVSTCGIVPRIYELAVTNPQLTLALSLHAPTQEKRRALMPVADSWEIGEVVRACRYYAEKTGRRVTFEYALIAGVNDTGQDAKELAELLRGFSCHVNLIPMNPVRERSFSASSGRATEEFCSALERLHINATVRRELGRDIDGACGQLRYKELSGAVKP